MRRTRARERRGERQRDSNTAAPSMDCLYGNSEFIVFIHESCKYSKPSIEIERARRCSFTQLILHVYLENQVAVWSEYTATYSIKIIMRKLEDQTSYRDHRNPFLPKCNQLLVTSWNGVFESLHFSAMGVSVSKRIEEWRNGSRNTTARQIT